MNSAAIYIKTDPKVKKEAQRVAKELGFSLSSLINGWLRQLVKTKEVSFSTHTHENEIPNARLRRSMREAKKNLKSGNHSPVFNTGEEAVAWLEKHGI